MKKNNQMQRQNHYLHNSLRWMQKIIANPPYLSESYCTEDFADFMRRETFLFSARYAKKNVVIHGQDKLLEATSKSGALLTPFHYGSFFLSGGAIVHQLNLNYTAIVTGRNIAPEKSEREFWEGVHYRSSCMYENPLFYTGNTPVKTMLNFVSKPGNLLCSLLDVRETGHFPNEYLFNYLGKQIYLQTGPARFAYLAKVPIIPMTIHYNIVEQKHHLFLGDPIHPSNDAVSITQQAISALEIQVNYESAQWFSNLLNNFSSPRI